MKEKDAPLDPKAIKDTGRHRQAKGFDPDGIFYLAAKGSFLVDTGEIYRAYTRKTPVINGVAQRIYPGDDPEEKKEAKQKAYHLISEIEINRAIDWAGEIAGFERGPFSRDGRNFLVERGPRLPVEDIHVLSPLIDDIVKQVLPDEIQRSIFLGWLKTGIAAIRQGCHCPAPMLVLAGDVNSGKSLLAWIVQQCFGGRMANPMTSWTGQLPWNDELLRSELLLIDDCTAETKLHARKKLGARFKEAIYGPEVQINTRNRSSMSFRPVWRVMICCNWEPHDLSVIPPLDGGMEDKIILLRTGKLQLPQPATTPEEKLELQRKILQELPGFVARVAALEIPAELADSRSGVKAYKNPQLYLALRDISLEGKLEQLIAMAMKATQFEEIAAPGDSQWLSAAEIQNALCERDSPTHRQAADLLKFANVTGKFLTNLAEDSHCPYIIEQKKSNGVPQYLLVYPEVAE